MCELSISISFKEGGKDEADGGRDLLKKVSRDSMAEQRLKAWTLMCVKSDKSKLSAVLYACTDSHD